MDVDIARALGEILAIQTGELNKDPYDQNALNRIRLISEAYSNFVGAEFTGFKADFEAGYQQAQGDVRRDQGPSWTTTLALMTLACLNCSF